MASKRWQRGGVHSVLGVVPGIPSWSQNKSYKGQYNSADQELPKCFKDMRKGAHALARESATIILVQYIL